MLLTQRPDTSIYLRPPILSTVANDASQKCRAKLFSNLGEVCDALHVRKCAPENCGDALFAHVLFKKGQSIHRCGQPFEALHLLDSGFLKTSSRDEFGNEQVLGFPMKGDLLGVEAIGTKQYHTETLALSDCNLILLPFDRLMQIGRSHAEFEQALYEIMSRELNRKQALMDMLCASAAETKVARFLTSLSGKFSDAGYSGAIFNLPMTRQEIASHLYLSMETVCRTLSVLDERGLIGVDRRVIRIVKHQELQQLCRVSRHKVQVLPH